MRYSGIYFKFYKYRRVVTGSSYQYSERAVYFKKNGCSWVKSRVTIVHLKKFQKMDLPSKTEYWERLVFNPLKDPLWTYHYIILILICLSIKNSFLYIKKNLINNLTCPSFHVFFFNWVHVAKVFSHKLLYFWKSCIYYY